MSTFSSLAQLTGAANSVLSTNEIKTVHETIAINFIGKKVLNQYEVGTAFYHSYIAKSIPALTKLAHGIITTDSNNVHYLYDAMGWFAVAALGDGQKILAENPSIDLMLRLAQYKLITSTSKQENVLTLIERIEETLNEIDEKELKRSSEMIAYSMILNTLEVQIPSTIVVRMLSRIIDILDEDEHLKEIADSFSREQDELPSVGENKPAQILFLYQGVRLSGLDDLSGLVTSLDALPPDKRDYLLSICDSDMDFTELLVNRAWWVEVRDGKLDVDKALKVFDHTARKSREWKVPELTRACIVAISVMHDEYGHSTERALAVLDAADQEFPYEARLINQRAKVLFHANRGSEALPIVNEAIELPGLSSVEFVFACRNAGIAAAKLNSWVEAERYFLLGAKKANNSSVQKSMGIGLMADAAFAQWKQKKYGNSLLLFADVLNSLGVIPITDDIRIRHLHATVRHSISWTHFDARKVLPENLVEPLPGMCSNQEPHEGIKDHRIIDLSAVWELLASTERILGLEIGIRDRSQVVTGGRKPLLLAGYERTLAFDQIFESKDFGNLVPRLIGLLEGFCFSKNLDKGEEDGWAIGDIPRLPDKYFENSDNLGWIYHYTLVASVICTVNSLTIPLPLERWRADLVNAGALQDGVKQFLDVLGGLRSDGTLYQQAAAAVFALRNSILAPWELWGASFRLLNALMTDRRKVEPALEGLLIRHWIFAARNQRFAFSAPSLVCPEVERCCLDETISGFAKIGAVLKVSASSLNIRMAPDAEQMIKTIIEQK